MVERDEQRERDRSVCVCVCDKGVADLYVYTWALILKGWVVLEGGLAHGNMATNKQRNEQMKMEEVRLKDACNAAWHAFETTGR